MPLSPSRFQQLLLHWFDLHGRKQLPWQINKTPYRVWVSEIMLQQTQVATVIPYFDRFMTRFPDIQSLAKASEDEVLHLWAGLGYYSRARNLHRAAIKVCDALASNFPDALEGLLSLPGIGHSTAGAILSIAYQRATPILDGNVKRVLARLHAISEPINDKVTENRLWSLAERYTPKERCADYTQAIMDLGATLCTRSKPDCPHCPLTRHCEGFQQGIAAMLPLKKATKTIPVRTATFLILQQDEHILLLKRPPSGIWGGLWSLPELPDQADTKAIRQYCRQTLQLSIKSPKPLTAFRHTFSHYHLDIHPVLAMTGSTDRRIMEDEGQIWYNPRQPAQIGLPKPVQTIMSLLI